MTASLGSEEAEKREELTEEEKEEEKESSVRKWRTLIAFWVFGLCNNFTAAVLLSAAQDILHKSSKDDSPSFNTTFCRETIDTRQCSTLSTGAVLICAIIPTLLVKLSFPFFIHRIPYSIRHAIVVLTQAAAFITVAFSPNLTIALAGVCISSFSSGVGEITYLALASHYSKYTIASFSSGTGAAGFAGSFLYAGMTDKRLLALAPKTVLLIMLFVPTMFAIAYYIVLVRPSSIGKVSPVQPRTWIARPHLVEANANSNLIKARHTTPWEKLVIVKSLLRYMIPVGLVYFGEYFINQGLVELIEFDCDHSFQSSPASQYRWYQVVYQIGAFVSRSSLKIVELSMLTISLLPVLQLGNVALFYADAVFRFIPHIWMLIALILFEGLVGGASYVNTFNYLHKQVPAEDREFALTAVSLADAAGVTLASFACIPVHNSICNMPIYN